MQLTAIEARILGALIEKESTTPDVYPLSLNALTTACNQTTNRDPVMDLNDDAVRWAINNLRQQSLVRAIQPSDSRVMKYRHLVTEKLDLDQRALAVVCVLLLRGEQTIGEIKTRTGRLAEFTNLKELEETLRGLITREIVTELPRRPGQKEVRYTHLLSGPVAASTEPESAGELPPPAVAMAAAHDRVAALEASIDELRRELADLRAQFEEFRQQFG